MLHRIILAFAAIILSTLTISLSPLTSDVRADAPPTQAVVIMYHRFGEQDFPSTNVTMDQFREHVAELKNGGYNVESLPKIVAALRNSEALPPKTVGLSVDDAYSSVYSRAWPILKEAGFPLTVFVATDPVDKQLPRYMSWEQLREISEEGVTIGSQTKFHPHMADLSRTKIIDELSQSNGQFEAKLGNTPDLFAYPYGVSNAYHKNDSKILKDNDFKLAFTTRFDNYKIQSHSPYSIPRMGLGNNNDDKSIRDKVYGLDSMIKKIW